MRIFSYVAVAFLVGLSNLVHAQDANIVETAILGGFNTLVQAVDFAGLVDALAAPTPLKTVFAPNDAAFAALPEGLLGSLLTEEGRSTLVDVLLYHVVSGQVLAADLSDGQVVTTLLGEDVVVSIGEEIKVNDSTVLATDVLTSNGVIHVIDAVLIPPALRDPALPNIVETAIAAGFDTLVTAVTFAELGDALAAPEPLKTVFAPTNEAFANLDSELLQFLLTEEGKQTLIDVLLYHVVGAQVLAEDLSDGQLISTLLQENVIVSIDGDSVKINDSNVVATDVLTSNGVIHVIDAVLIPPSLREPELPNIVETAIAAGFDTLVAAVTFAELGDALVAPQPLKTVFAPTNEAFNALDADLLSFLLTEDGKPTLVDVLLYHVVGQQVFAADLTDGQIVATLLGEDVVVSITSGTIKINDSTVLTADVATSNGVIHVIDAVLIPPALRVPNLVDTAIAAGFDTLVAAVSAAGLVEALIEEEPLKTVFAPTNEAFAALGDEALAFLLTPKGLPRLTDVLLYHVLGVKVLSTDLSDGLTATTLLGSDVTITIADGQFFVNESEIIAVDIEASNGVVHVIDAVLIPPGFLPPADIPGTAVAGGFNTLVAALTATDLVGAVSSPNGPFTVFAPTDEAFAALPFGALQGLLTEGGLPVLTDILLYHVVSGEVASTDLTNGQEVETLFGATVTVSLRGPSIFINDSLVVQPDIFTLNGVVHAIDAVLLFDGVEVPLPSADIVETAVSAGFSTLVAAVTFAELGGALAAPTPLKTVFAPTNEAFANLPESILGFLLTDAGKGTLTDILLYHVVAEPFFSSDLTDGLAVTTLLGEDVTVSAEFGDLFINDSKVVLADVVTTNGVVHAIDAVLLQPSLFTGDIPGTAVAAGSFNILVAALTATDLAGAVAFPNGPFTVFAPTDDAFLALPFGVLANLLNDHGIETLAEILLYHVVSGAFLLDDIRNGERIETLLGDTVVFRSRGGPTINDSNIVAADITTSNGVIHVIDAVLTFPELELPFPEENIVDLAIDGDFDTLVAAVSFAGLVEALADEDAKFTVFAPPNEAFAALPEGLLGFYLTDAGKGILTDILLYHVVPEPFTTLDLSDGLNITTLEGNTVTVSIDDGALFINDSKIVAANLAATNGIVHAIDAVLLQPSLFTGDIPGTAVDAGIFSTLVTALTATDLVGAVSFPNGPFTVFAPTNDAFAELPGTVLELLLEESGLSVLANVLLYHVVSGVALSTDLFDGQNIETSFLSKTVEVSITDSGDLFINDSLVVAADIVTSNGVVHAIDSVLLFDDFFVSTPGADIAGTAVAAGFDTLVAALGATDLVGAVSEPNGPLTVFAPTNEAFAALPFDTVSKLLLPENLGTLADVLLYHVISGFVLSTSLREGKEIETLFGDTLVVSVNRGIFINDSRVVTADITVSNGVIHVIDAVLISDEFPAPVPTKNIVETAIDGGFDTLVAAVSFAGLVDALLAETPLKTVFAPTDEAFAALPQDLLGFYLTEGGKSVLTDILLYHVVGQPVLAEDLSDGATVTTLLGEDVVVSIDGGAIKINDSNVLATDVLTTNGVIHVIDAVLLQPSLFETDIPGTAVAGGFEILVTALTATDLAGAVAFPNGPFTVFAPTDEAFANLGDVLDDLLEEEDLETLTDILLYHVVSGVFFLEDLRNGERIDTLLGHTVVFRTRDGPVVNQSNIIAADIGTSNGVVHAIDAVLLFPDLRLP